MTAPILPVSFPAQAGMQAIQPIPSVSPAPWAPQAQAPQAVHFADVLKKAVAELQSLQNDSGKAVQQLATGEAKNLHDVVLAMEKAGLALQLAVQIRNKVLDAYQEIIRMQL